MQGINVLKSLRGRRPSRTLVILGGGVILHACAAVFSGTKKGALSAPDVLYPAIPDEYPNQPHACQNSNARA